MNADSYTVTFPVFPVIWRGTPTAIESGMTETNEHFTTEAGLWRYKGTPISDMLAYPVQVAAKVMGIGYSTLMKEVARGRINRTPLKVIPKSEVERYLREQVRA